jgi:hypothetical protein
VPKTKAPTFSWANTTPAQQAKVLEYIGGDGHTIWNPDALKMDAADTTPIDYIIDAFTTEEKSDQSYKGSIFSSETGERQESMRGVYGLTVIRSLARHYGVTSTKFGRGSEARELTAGILEHLGKEQGA